MSEVVTATIDLDAHDARELTDRIRATLRTGHDLVIKAFVGRAWDALGYDGWDAYCAGEFNEARMIRLPAEQRREIVAEMTEAGMSTRAIASGLGIDKNTVMVDRRQVSESQTPGAVTGTDGKTYTRPAPAPAPLPDHAQREADAVPDIIRDASLDEFEAALAAGREEGDLSQENVVAHLTSVPTAASVPTRQRRPLTESFAEAARALQIATERLVRLTEDDRFPRNRQQVADDERGDLLRIHDALAGVIERLSRA